MVQPNELTHHLPMELTGGILSTTTKVWEILVASKNGDLVAVQKMVADCPELIYAQYNYTPPIHFAVREGHIELIRYLLDHGAHSPDYKIYPFQESLQTIATDRSYHVITALLDQYAADASRQVFKGDNGVIQYNRNALQTEFEQAVYKEDLRETAKILKQHPGLAKDHTFFWGEGILAFAAKKNNRSMIDLLLNYGATVPGILKWARFYYFERYDGAAYMMEKGMNPDTMSWHHVTLLHDMAQKGNMPQAELLIRYGAAIDPVDEEYQSTPLGMASRWGHTEMVEYLLEQGADPNKAGASWATPLAWAQQKEHEEIEEILLRAGALPV